MHETIADKLKLLAAWLDRHDRVTGHGGPPEVQQDLRGLAELFDLLAFAHDLDALAAHFDRRADRYVGECAGHIKHECRGVASDIRRLKEREAIFGVSVKQEDS